MGGGLVLFFLELRDILGLLVFPLLKIRDRLVANYLWQQKAIAFGTGGGSSPSIMYGPNAESQVFPMRSA